MMAACWADHFALDHARVAQRHLMLALLQLLSVVYLAKTLLYTWVGQQAPQGERTRFLGTCGHGRGQGPPSSGQASRASSNGSQAAGPGCHRCCPLCLCALPSASARRLHHASGVCCGGDQPHGTSSTDTEQSKLQILVLG